MPDYVNETFGRIIGRLVHPKRSSKSWKVLRRQLAAISQYMIGHRELSTHAYTFSCSFFGIACTNPSYNNTTNIIDR